MPEELARRESRLKKMQQAKAELEQEAREKAEQERAEAEAKIAARHEEEEQTGKKPRGREPQIPAPDQAQPDAKAQRNFTDPESRIMPDGANKGSFVQGYNAQIAVDCDDASDRCGGYYSAGQRQPATAPDARTGGGQHGMQARPSQRRCRLLEPGQRHRSKHRWNRPAYCHGPHPTQPSRDGQRAAAEPATAKQAMHHKLRGEAGRAVYKMRKAIVEPVFGQIKEIRGFRRFSMRGREWRGRMEAGVRNRQLPQAVRLRMDAANGMNGLGRLLPLQ